MSPIAAMDLDTVLDDIATAPAIETKSARPQGGDDPIRTLAASIDRQTAVIEAKASPSAASAAPARTPAPVTLKERLEKARGLAALRETAEREERRHDPINTDQMRRINRDLDRRNDDDIAELKSQVRAQQREIADLRRKSARPGGPLSVQQQTPEAMKNAAFALYRKASMHYLRTGQEIFDGRHLKEIQDAVVKLDAKAFNATVGPEGGYFVLPEQETGPVERLLGAISPMRQLATIRNISAASFKTRINRRGSTARWVGETTPSTTDSTASFAELEYPAFTLLSEPEYTLESMEDPSIDPEALLADDSQYDFAEMESAGFVTGTGFNQPKGIVSAGHTYVASASWTWGSGPSQNVGYLATGADGAFASSAGADVLMKLPMELKAAFRQNASWLLGRTTIGTVRTLKDSQNRYIWGEGDISKGQPNTINGYTANEDEQMPDIASGSYSIGFGDWRQAYLIVDRIGFQVFRNPYINYPNVRMHMRKRVGGAPKRYDAYRVVKFATS